MSAVRDNRQFYATTAFDNWASRMGLTAFEDVLVDRFLDADRSTLEAGTGAGRILFALQEREFEELHGFDFVPGFIEIARERDLYGTIEFTVQDAVDLAYPDRRFEQALYLQQVVCFIEDPADRLRAMREARRVLRPGGTALFSFLCFESRTKRTLHASFLRYLRVQRRLRRRRVSLQYQPWLLAGGAPNLGAIIDRPPYVYWYRLNEALESLEGAGFQVEWAGSTAQVTDETWSGDPRALASSRLDGMLYLACSRAV